MSASKKKMQRREAENTEKVTQAQAEQTAYKKKVRLYTVIGIVVVVLVAALLIWNSGIFQRNATAATIGEEKLSVAELSYYYYNSEMRYLFSAYGILDSTKGDDEQIYNTADGTTYQDYFLEQALQTAQQVYVMYSSALENGYTDADVKDSVESEIETLKSTAAAYGYDYKSFLKANYGRYMTTAAMEKIITRTLLAELYSSDLYSETFDSYTETDLETYYNEHADEVDSFTYSYLYFTPETVSSTNESGEERTEEEIATLEERALAAAKLSAENALELYNNGTDVYDIIQDTDPYASADHQTVVGISSISSTYSEELLKLDMDEAALVENGESGYYVIVNHGRELNKTLSVNVRHILFNAETTTDENGSVVAPTEEAWAAALAEAEAALAEFEAGELTGEAFGALAEKYSDDAGSNTNGGLYESVMEGDFVTEFNDWMFGEEERQTGDTSIIRHEGNATTEQYPYWGYHVTFIDGFGEETWKLNVRETVATNTVTDLRTELCEAAPAELAAAAYSNIGK